MARKSTVQTNTPQQQAEAFAASIGSLSQGIAWMGGLSTDLRKQAAEIVGIETSADGFPLSDYSMKKHVGILKLWQLTGIPAATPPTFNLGDRVIIKTDAGDAKQFDGKKGEVTFIYESGRRSVKIDGEEEEFDFEPAELTIETPPAQPAKADIPPPNAEETEHNRLSTIYAIRAREKLALAEVAVAEEDVENAKGVLKHKEAKLELIRKELGETIDGKPIQMELELEKPAGSGESTTSDAWRNVPINTIGLKPKVIKAFEEHEPRIETVGQFADWQKQKGEFWAKDIKGIGPGAAEEISDCMMKFWAEHPEATAAESADAQ